MNIEKSEIKNQRPLSILPFSLGKKGFSWVVAVAAPYVCALCSYVVFLLVCMCSDTRERGGPGEAPDTAVSISLQGDRTAGDRQNSLSPSLCGPQR